MDDDIDAIINESLDDDLAIKDIEEFENSLKNMTGYYILLTTPAKLFLISY